MCDLILVLFVALLCIKLKVAKKRQIFGDYLSLENTTALRGALAIIIILHHMSERIQNTKIFLILMHSGYLVVSVFFFLSGVGLIASIKKGSAYLHKFLTHRVLYFLIVYLFVTVLYIIEKILTGKITSINYILKSFVSFNPIASNSWYMIVLILYYLIFWISFKIFKSSNQKAIIAVFLFQIALTIIFVLCGAPSIWYISGFAYVAGMFWVYNDENN